MVRYSIVRRGLPAALLPFAALASGCVTRGDVAVRQSVVASVAQQAAGQIRRCYRTPRVASAGKQISTRVRVRFQPDGSLADVPLVVAQGGVTAENRAYAGRMAEAAGLAVISCAPLKLPPELYANGWNELDFTFSPGARA
jgi:hypothetical protein